MKDGLVRALRRVVPPLMADGLLGLRARVQEARYAWGARGPWSPGYEAHKGRFLAAAVADAAVLALFRDGAPLPAGYGAGLDERCIEYPWVLAHLPPGPLALLDAGSALNHALLLDRPALREKAITIVTLAPEAESFWQRGVSYLYSDLRRLPLRDEHYEVCACVSTLEHVGCDNTQYTGSEAHREDRPQDVTAVMRELRRVLRPGGILLLTVPFGVPRHFGTFRQLDAARLEEVVEAGGPWAARRDAFYRYWPGGWARANAAECADAEYVEWVARPRAAWPRPVPVESDRAAAARAVACVRLEK